MKKLLCIILILLLCSSHALAESKSITFRGVDWGSSSETVKDSFDSSVRWESPEYNSCFGMEYWIKGKGKVYSGKVCTEIHSQFSNSNRVQVAGKGASDVVLRFAVVPGSEEPAFIMAEYLFASGDLLDTMVELALKLSDLYGEYETHMEFTPILDIYYVWKDSKGNTISLYNHGDSIISLRYISSKIDKLLAEAADAADKEEKADYSGL